MDDPLRGTGRTLGLMLVAIGAALQKQGEWVEFVDHHSSRSVLTAQNHHSRMVSLCKQLKLPLMDVERNGSKIRIRSTRFA